jgi:hypothetical protein
MDSTGVFEKSADSLTELPGPTDGTVGFERSPDYLAGLPIAEGMKYTELP